MRVKKILRTFFVGLIVAGAMIVYGTVGRSDYEIPLWTEGKLVSLTPVRLLLLQGLGGYAFILLGSLGLKKLKP